jgi:CheY-like chemotaxis protein
LPAFLRGVHTKILIVDDNLLLASLLQIMLEDEGYEACCAGDGLEGYAAYLFFRPEVVVTDLHMPRANGLEMMERIRRLNPGVKAIYMSGDLLPYRSLLEEEARRYPVSILSKPFSKDDLLGLLAGCGNGGTEGVPPASVERFRTAG